MICVSRSGAGILSLIHIFKFYKYPVGSSSEHEAECKASFFTTEISFISRNCITLANLLHELLHLYAYLKYKTYTDGNYAACEEYEIRVLTDLIMRRDFKGISFTHQGMRSSDKLYTPYICLLYTSVWFLPGVGSGLDCI